jgi:8-oxo-dGTP diphosphatase
MGDSHRYSVSVAGAVINHDGRVLATRRRDNGHWEPPGGVLEPGETMQAGVVREVLEETGLRVDPARLSGVYQNMERNIVSVVFRCSVVSGTLRVSDETTEFRWLDSEECRALMTPAYAVRLTDAIDSTQPAARSHDGVALV